jgi:hypothetical protein
MKVPIYLSGAIRKELAGRPEFGFMYTPNMGNKLLANSAWFADNGCFSSKGERTFNLDAYLTWLRMRDSSMCIGATAPDKVGDAVETLKRSLPVLHLLREAGYKASLVAQDGLTVDDYGLLSANKDLPDGGRETIHISWNAFDVLFIGGTTEYKLGPEAAKIVAEAKRRGKWVHMGRVNSWKRYLIAAHLDCDSVDGTFLAFGPTQNLIRLEGWVSKLKQLTNQGENNNENDIPMWRNQQTVGFGCEGLERSSEDGPGGAIPVS